MQALEYVRSVPRWLAVRALGGIAPGVATGPLSCLRLAEREPPALPGEGWVRVRPRLAGICGSDLATIASRGSLYFSAVTSFPFVPGHEVVGEVLAPRPGEPPHGLAPGERVVLEPALGCRVRAVEPPCPACAAGQQGNCVNVGRGRLAPGVQTGYCRDTGGGWSEELVAHASQLHRVPESVPDEDAVLVEPFACALHAALRAEVREGETALVLGAGTLGLLTLLALRRVAPRATLWIAAKHAHQAALARALGADDVLPSGSALAELVVARTGARRHEPQLGESVVLGGVDAALDCVGAARTLDAAVRLTRARGTVVLVGMPGVLRRLEGTALWFQETRLLGAYAYGEELVDGRRARTFALALEAAAESPGLLARLLTGRHPLAGYRRAIADAVDTGRARSVKTAFDLRELSRASRGSARA